jgi:hypothetical protein
VALGLAPGVGADGVRAGGGSGRRGRRPHRLPGEHGLPEGRDHGGEHRQERDQLYGRLALLIAEMGHGTTIARNLIAETGHGATIARNLIAETGHGATIARNLIAETGHGATIARNL